MNKFLKDLQKNRYNEIKGYKVDRWIFNFFMLVIFAYLFFIAYAHNFNLDYYYCSTPNPGELCENPFYKPVTWKNQQYLTPGEYGQKPTALFNSAGIVSIILLLSAFAFNHFTYNRKYQLMKKISKYVNER